MINRWNLNEGRKNLKVRSIKAIKAGTASFFA